MSDLARLNRGLQPTRAYPRVNGQLTNVLAVVIVILAWTVSAVAQEEHLNQSRGKNRASNSSEDGFVQLFNGKDLSGWKTKGNWIPQGDESLLIKPSETERGWARFDSYLWSEKKFSDFELRLECAYPPNGNSGIYFRVADPANPVNTGIEVQVFDSSAQKTLTDHTLGGIIPAGIPPQKNLAKVPGEWNEIVIRCVGQELVVTVNGEQVVDVNLDKTAVRDRKSAGFLGLQDHGFGHNVKYRNIRIREIGSSANDVDAAVLFQSEVLPIFEESCLHCHGEDEKEGGLQLDSLTNVLRGGDSGEPVLVIGDDAQSHLIKLLISDNEDERMPPDDDALSNAQVETIRKWIRAKKGWEEAAKEARTKTSDHWAYQPIKKPSPVLTPIENPIDYFIRKKLKEVGIEPSQVADERTLIRRLYLVLHGLPPTPEQVEEFCNEADPGKWERLIETLLERPQYGERMAVGWLDLIRFSETDGFEMNTERPDAWRYRDWVIKAFNQDMPFDEFVTHQLAGDTTGQPIATGYLVAGPHNQVVEQDERGQAENVQNETSDMLNAVGTSLLGMTLGCARCHNHKFDPISQSDFYSVQAIFSGVQHGTTQLPIPRSHNEEINELRLETHRLRDRLAEFFPEQPSRESLNFKRNVETFSPVDAKYVRMSISGTLQKGVPACIDEIEVFSQGKNVARATSGAKAISGGDFQHPFHKLSHINDGKYGNEFSWISREVRGWVQIELDEVCAVEQIVWGRDRTGSIRDRLATGYRFEVSVDGKTWQTVADSKQRQPLGSAEISYDLKTLAPKARKTAAELLQLLNVPLAKLAALESPRQAYAGVFSQPKPTYRLYRGDPMEPRELVEPDTIVILGDLDLSIHADSASRRNSFAKWVVAPSNPLTARVIVNRIWQFHFGTGIVSTPNDFGLNGSPPSHPELLDWLATELMENNWSIKHIHRLILNSKTWQQASFPNRKAIEVDGGSRLLWRFPPRRLEAELIRDSILVATGKLNSKSYGPGFSGFEVQLENVRHYFPKEKYGPTDWRRMVYMTRVRKESESVFGVFDCPDGNQVTPRRTISTTPLQALNLLNSDFILEQATFLAERIQAKSLDRTAQVKFAYQLCFNRSATIDEMKIALDIIDDLGLVQLCRVLLNTNEFVFIL